MERGDSVGTYGLIFSHSSAGITHSRNQLPCQPSILHESKVNMRCSTCVLLTKLNDFATHGQFHIPHNQKCQTLAAAKPYLMLSLWFGCHVFSHYYRDIGDREAHQNFLCSLHNSMSRTSVC
ncbi:uncharacterized protein [Rutidosis leptorrhynchoides]|uniref:uncharacterized protein n=1 Tax=Rutidosis leptorrhynchoides TaxID=125765 RepID=UPI003A9A4D38